MRKLFIASDHAAFQQKKELVSLLSVKYTEHFELIDLGTDSEESTHYPLYGQKIAKEVLLNKASQGIALCGSGIGISIQVNRFKGIRGALCQDTNDAKMARLHNNANIICLPGRKFPTSQLEKMIDIWITSEFEGGRHQKRIDMLDSMN